MVRTRLSNPAFKWCDDCDTKFYPVGRFSRLCLACQNKTRLERAKKKAEKMFESLSLTVEKREHRVWTETEPLVKGQPALSSLARKYIDRWHYIYRSDAGEISLVHITTGISSSRKMWEILMLNKQNKTERFATKKEAVARIKEILL